MLNLVKKLFISTTSLYSGVQADIIKNAANGPGMALSFSEDGVNSAANILIPTLFANFNITIPEIIIDGGYFRNIVVKIPTPNVEDVKFSFLSADNALGLTANNIVMDIDADFSFKAIITVTGQAHIVIHKLNLDIQMDVGTQPGINSHEEFAPHINIPKVLVTIDPADIEITLTGGLVARIAQIFIPIIKNTVIPDLIKTLETTIQGDVTTNLNTQLATLTSIAIPGLAGVTTDISQLLGGPQFNDQKVFTMAVNGTSYDANNIAQPSYSPASYDASNIDGKQLQAYLTDYTLNTALDAGYSTGNTLDISGILALLNITITTDQVGLLIPQIITKYGAGKNVSVSGSFITAPSHVSMTPQGQEIDTSFSLTLVVEGETCLHVPISHSILDGLLASRDGKIFGLFSKAQVGDFDDASYTSTLGITAEAMKTEMQANLDNVVANINALLAEGIIIPEVFGIDISDVDLKFNDGYLAFGATVTPAFWLGFQSVFSKIWEHSQTIQLMQAMPELFSEEEIATHILQ